MILFLHIHIKPTYILARLHAIIKHKNKSTRLICLLSYTWSIVNTKAGENGGNKRVQTFTSSSKSYYTFILARRSKINKEGHFRLGAA